MIAKGLDMRYAPWLILGLILGGLALAGCEPSVTKTDTAKAGAAATAATRTTETPAVPGRLPKASVLTGQTPQKFAGAPAGGDPLAYLLYVPQDYAKAAGPWPLVLFMHGSGERGDNLDLVKIHGPPKLIAAGQTFPALIASPQCPLGKDWVAEMKTLEALLDDLQAKYDIDARRIYVTGLSMGGSGTWALAIDQPARFAAVAPICGRGDPAKVAALKGMPAWVFHGNFDNTVPLKFSRDMVDTLRAAGGEVKFTVYPDAAHDSWTATYNDEKFWKWLFEQRKK
jgi:predicted peptidase